MNINPCRFEEDVPFPLKGYSDSVIDLWESIAHDNSRQNRIL